ncbi:MAG: cache domain-containing protein [Rhodospirillaceae bacterium]|nr:cache domain-containing protein [Rhodospirillaceae bacterium]
MATSPVTSQKEPRRFYYLRHDGLIFGAGHSVLRENLADVVVDYVNNAIAHYEREGLDATVAFYNSQASVDGPLYLFLMDATDIYLVHPIFPHLIGTDIKDVVGSNGYELGKEIAKATEAGHWVEYLWPNPVTEVEEAKTAWVIRHAGLIFASGYYTADTEAGEPAWKTADPREYTVEYVQRAIERYDRDGLEAMAAYYNSVASFEGQFYLFAMDANDIYFVHPLFPRLRGTDIKDVVGSDGYELGKEIAKATEAGHWIEYLWPHPVTLREVPKVAYAIRHDGRIFASGYYPSIEDPAGRTRAYVQEAIDRYEREGLEATVAYYNSLESVDGQWHLTLLDENDIYLVHPLLPVLVGKDIKRVGERILSSDVRRALLGATAEGQWVRYQVPNPRATGTVQRHQWVVRHDGLTFSSAYYEEE